MIYFNGKPVQTLCWIAEWAFDSFSFSRKYLQLDASFYALQPYVFCVPLLIINNASLPLGIIIGPSEHQNLFSEFFDLINKSTILPFDCLGILSDEGKSITIKLIAEAIDSRDDAYVSAWGNNPPDEWFAATSHSRN